MTSIHEITVIHAPIQRCFDLARSIEVHVLGKSHTGDQTLPLEAPPSGLLALGDKVTWQSRHFGRTYHTTAQITQFDPPHAFQDTMLTGPYAWVQHDHFFIELPGERTVMRDVLRYAAPIPLLGRVAERFVLDDHMARVLHRRNLIIKQVAESDTWHHFV